MPNRKEPSTAAVLEFLSAPAGRTAISNAEDCPVAIAATSGNLRVRGKTKSYPGASKADVVAWAEDNVDGFSEWFSGAPAPAPPARSASVPARQDEPDSSSDESGGGGDCESVGDGSECQFEEARSCASDDDGGAPVPRDAGRPRAPRPAKVAPKPAQSASVSAVPLFQENARVRTDDFYDWILEMRYLTLDKKSGNFRFESIASQGPHQRLAQERFYIGRRFTIADCKKAAARKWGIPGDTLVPNKGNLAELREQAALTGDRLEEAVRLMRALDRVKI